MVFESSCVLVGDGGVETDGEVETDVQFYTDSRTCTFTLRQTVSQVFVFSSRYCVLAQSFLVVLSEIELLNSAMKFRWRRRRKISWVVFLLNPVMS